MDQHIKLIIKEEISLLLTAGNKIVTKNEGRTKAQSESAFSH